MKEKEAKILALQKAQIEALIEKYMSCNSKTACFPVNYTPHSLQPGWNAVSGAIRLQTNIVG